MSDGDIGGGEWGGEPIEVDSGNDSSTSLQSPNYGNDGETFYQADWCVDTDGTEGSGLIVIKKTHSKGNSSEGDMYAILTYDDLEDPEQQAGMKNALDKLENGEIPSAEGSSVMLLDSNGNNETGKKKGRGKRIKAWFKKIFGGGDGGFYIPYFPDEEGERPGEGAPGGQTPLGPTVLWVQGEQVKVIAEGAIETEAWMAKNL